MTNIVNNHIAKGKELFGTEEYQQLIYEKG